MNRLQEIEQMSEAITKDTLEILNKNFPMDSRFFLTGDDAEKVKQNDDQIVELDKEYSNIYRSLSTEQRSQCNYKNIRGLYYQDTHNSKGLIKVSSMSDEYELNKAFSKATSFGMDAIEKMYKYKNDENKEEYLKNKDILDQCVNILSVHFWGENRIKHLQEYSNRLESGRTYEDDVKEYNDLIIKANKVTYEYAKSILAGITVVEQEMFNDLYEDIFNKEKKLKEFLPIDFLTKNGVNFHWMKIDAERTPEKIINMDNEKQIEKTL